MQWHNRTFDTRLCHLCHMEIVTVSRFLRDSTLAERGSFLCSWRV